MFNLLIALLLPWNIKAGDEVALHDFMSLDTDHEGSRRHLETIRNVFSRNTASGPQQKNIKKNSTTKTVSKFTPETKQKSKKSAPERSDSGKGKSYKKKKRRPVERFSPVAEEKKKKRPIKKDDCSSSPSTQAPVTTPVITRAPVTQAPVTPPVTLAPVTTAPSLSPAELFVDLDLKSMPEAYHSFFQGAAMRWSEVIIGELETVTIEEEREDTSCRALPDEIDNVFICSELEEIDGIDGVLGYAGPEYIRETDGLPYIGAMFFDVADAPILAASGEFTGLVLHEMGHVFGLGTLWEDAELVDVSSGRCQYTGEIANRIYQEISGCSTSLPLEQEGGEGTACVHWDEDCLVDELMTGFITGSLPLSNITIGGLEDLGYKVSYSVADPFTSQDLHPGCVCSATRESSRPEFGKYGAVRTSFRPKQPELSREGYLTAYQFGLRQLRKKKKRRTFFGRRRRSNGKYVGDQYLTVLYKENGRIFTVDVRVAPGSSYLLNSSFKFVQDNP